MNEATVLDKAFFLDKALCLPAPDIDALCEGRIITIVPSVPIQVGWRFALYPCNTSTNLLPLEQHYHSNLISKARASLVQLESEPVEFKAWARCEFFTMLYPDGMGKLATLSQHTTWTQAAFREMLEQQQHISLACLRVYQLPQSIAIPVNNVSVAKAGKFIGLPALGFSERLSELPQVTEFLPVINDVTFNKRKQWLADFKPLPYPELEELQGEMAQLAITNPTAKRLNYEIQTLLGWVAEPPTREFKPELAWINVINSAGTATTGGNYEKGTAFERVVHKSLDYLGFEIDPDAAGGSGGMDLYCTSPYRLVGECKAGQSITDHAPEELMKIGRKRLGAKAFFDDTIKLIIGPGKPTKPLQESAKEFGISIINSMTLQKLVELQAKYPGSVNLIELKSYLESGQTDEKIDVYIDKVSKDLALRSQIVKLVKDHLEKTNSQEIDFYILYGLYVANQDKLPKPEEFHEILVELSSPLTGYLGRTKGDDWKSDRFYFLRELPVIEGVLEIIFIVEKTNSSDVERTYVARSLGRPSTKWFHQPILVNAANMKDLCERVSSKVCDLFPETEIESRPRFAFYLQTVGNEIVVTTSKIEG